MLTYFGSGKRDYANKPIRAGRPRPFWEFQAVLAGEIARVESSPSAPPNFHRKSLWLSRPGSSHGWAGRREKRAEVLVFHFRLLPKVAEQPLGSRSHFRVDLGKVACARLIELGRRVTHYWRNPSPGMLLVAESVRAELSFLVYEGFSDAGIPAKSAGAEQVGRALEVYGARMAENPTLGEIAAAAGLSVAHLRRLFHAHMGHSPKEAFDQLRERRILELLTDSDYSLEAIAEATGFSEASALSRAFKKRFGSPPSAMRRRLSG